jgi:hypothetical protein
MARATATRATGAPVIRSPWPRASAAFCSAVRPSLRPVGPRRNQYSPACSKRSGCPSASEPTTGGPVPPTPSAGSHNCPPGGSAWGSSLNSSSPAHPSKPAAMRAGIVPSKRRPPARRPPRGLPNNAQSLASAKHATASARTKPSLGTPQPHAMRSLRV